MSLVGAAILPHNPLLVPTVGLQNQQYFKSTLQAIEKTIEFIESLNVDTIIILSSHNTIVPETFLINLCSEYKVNFTKFGDLNTNLSYKTNTGAAYRLKESLETKLPVSLISESDLDYNFGVILYFFQNKLYQKSIIPIYSTNKQNDLQNVSFGEAIINLVNNDSQKFFVIASGDLSHQNKSSAKVNSQYDHLLIKNLKQNNFKQITDIPLEIIINAHQCIHNPILILSGILNKISFSTEIYSFENIFGVGLLTAVMKL